MTEKLITHSIQDKEREISGSTLAVILLTISTMWSVFKWLDVSMDAVNALFSGLAFAVLIFTVFLQRRELQETRKELMRTATAQEASEKALNAQADAAAQSTKLAAMNSLLKFYRDEMNNIRTKLTTGTEQYLAFRLIELEDREKKLLQILDDAYYSITSIKSISDAIAALEALNSAMGQDELQSRFDRARQFLAQHPTIDWEAESELKAAYENGLFLLEKAHGAYVAKFREDHTEFYKQ